MKKLFIIVLISTIIITGCTKPTSEVQTKTNSYENNLIEEQEIKTDDEFVNYIKNVELEVENITTQEELTVEDQKVLENTFITLTDFIFYDGEINGVTFDELTDSAKEKVLDIYQKIDSKIESKFPNYKENIASTSKNVYANIRKEVEELKDKYIDEYGQEKYDNLENAYNEGKESLKDSAKNTYETLKDVSEEFYEETKNKAENWYKNYKESRN